MTIAHYHRTGRRGSRASGNTKHSQGTSTYTSLYASIYSYIYPSIHPSIHPPIHPSIHPSTYILSTTLAFYLTSPPCSAALHDYRTLPPHRPQRSKRFPQCHTLPRHIYIHISLCTHLFIYISIHPSVHPSVRLPHRSGT